MCSTTFHLWQDNPIIPLFLELWGTSGAEGVSVLSPSKTHSLLKWFMLFNPPLGRADVITVFSQREPPAYHSSGCNAVLYAIHLSHWHRVSFGFLSCICLIWAIQESCKTLDCSALLWIHSVGSLGIFHGGGGIMGACWTYACCIMLDRVSPII